MIIKRIELTVNINEHTPYAVTRHQARIRHFVDVLHAHAEDKYRKTLLQYLHVKLTIIAYQYPALGSFLSIEQFEKHMFALECLAEVTGIPTFKSDGIPEWVGQCLRLRMRGTSDDLKTLEWPDKTFRRKNQFRGLSKVSTKASWPSVLTGRSLLSEMVSRCWRTLGGSFRLNERLFLDVSTSNFWPWRHSQGLVVGESMLLKR